MKITPIISKSYKKGLETITRTKYTKGCEKLIVTSVTINSIRTSEIKRLYNGHTLIKRVLIVFNEFGKRIEKYII